MPLSPGGILPRDMDSRQWATFVSQSGIQADRSVKTFTPTWAGFSADPVGDINYMDFGAIVMMWIDEPGSLTGTSDTSDMSFTGVPAAIRPTGIRMTQANALIDNSGLRQGHARVLTDGSVDFWISVVNDDGAGQLYVELTSGFFHNTSGKGLGAGWLIVYAK